MAIGTQAPSHGGSVGKSGGPGVAPGIAGLEPASQAAVLSGGGARGAYEVGVLKALLEGASPVTGFRPILLDFFSGTSVGAFNAAFLASRSKDSEARSILDLETLWRETIANTMTSCGNGIFRIRGAPFQFLDPGCLLHPIRNTVDLFQDAAVLGGAFAARGVAFLRSDERFQQRLLQSIDIGAFFSEQPLESLVAENIDLRSLSASGVKLAVVASNWRYGTPQVFDAFDLTHRYGSLPVLASAALPGLFPPVPIEGIPYVDGAVTMNTPLNPAIDSGADVLHVIFVDPRLGDVPLPRLPSTLDSVYRLYLTLVADKFNVDLGTAAMVNDALRLLGLTGTRELLQAPGNPLSEASPLGRAIGRMRQGEPYRPLEIHKYRPRNVFGSGFDILDFHHAQIDRLIADGYADAVAHDCAAEGCLVVDPASPMLGDRSFPMPLPA